MFELTENTLFEIYRGYKKGKMKYYYFRLNNLDEKWLSICSISTALGGFTLIISQFFYIKFINFF